jgi:hypothetical protein
MTAKRRKRRKKGFSGLTQRPGTSELQSKIWPLNHANGPLAVLVSHSFAPSGFDASPAILTPDR